MPLVEHEPRYGVTVGARCDFPGVVESEEAWRRADEIRRKVRAVLAEHGVPYKDPLVVVWDSGGIVE